MSYVQSQAFPGKGSVIAVSNGGSPDVWTVIGEVKNIKPSARKIDKYDASNMESGAYKEFKPGLIDPGMYDVTMNGVPTDAGQLALDTNFTAGTIAVWGIKYPPASITGAGHTVPQVLQFSAFVEEADHEDLDVTKLAERTFKLQITGAVTVTPEGTTPAPF